MSHFPNKPYFSMSFSNCTGKNFNILTEVCKVWDLNLFGSFQFVIAWSTLRVNCSPIFANVSHHWHCVNTHLNAPEEETANFYCWYLWSTLKTCKAQVRRFDGYQESVKRPWFVPCSVLHWDFARFCSLIHFISTYSWFCFYQLLWFKH